MTMKREGRPTGIDGLPGADRMRELTGRARETLDNARSKAGETLAATRAKGEAVVGDAKDKAFRAADETNRIFQEHPVAAVAAAVAAGAVVGIFLPRLNLTRKVVGAATRIAKVAATAEAAQTLLGRLTEAGHAARESATQAAHAAPGQARRAVRQIVEAPPVKAARAGASDMSGRVRRAARELRTPQTPSK